MSISILTITTLIWVHWFADFVVQTDKMAVSKSSSNNWLSIHVGVYTLILMLFGWKFALVNGALHWITDYFSSRATTKLWQKGDRHNFFVVIGIDQAVHLNCLLLTAPLIGW